MGNCQSPRKPESGKKNQKDENIARIEYSIYLYKIQKEIKQALPNNIPNELCGIIFHYLMISLIEHIYHIFYTVDMRIPFSIDEEQFHCKLSFCTDTIYCCIFHCSEDVYCTIMHDKFDYPMP